MQNDVKYDQYYTNEAVAADCYRVFCEHFNPIFCKMVEPSAGTGSFFKLLPSRSLGYDVEPKHPGIRQADFLTVEIRSEWKVAVIGNPPFGKNASMAVRFFNHAAREARIIAMIVPRTFRKAKIQNRLDRNFHLVREVAVPKNAFVFRNRRYDVPTIFQIWERRPDRTDALRVCWHKWNCDCNAVPWYLRPSPHAPHISYGYNRDTNNTHSEET